MNTMLLKKVAGVVALLGLLSASFAATAVERHGALTTSGHYLLNKNGNIVQLRGMSFYWSTESWAGYQYYNAGTVNSLINDWKCTVLRVAYDRNSGNNSGWAGCQAVIQAAIDKGIYVIIDWHSHTAHQQADAAVAFFKEQAAKYKNTPNVIFEPYNEPKTTNGNETDGSQATAIETWKGIKGYLTKVTQAIRDAGAPNLVIVGTPYFCQFVNVASDDPLVDKNGKPFTNLAYTFHFYAASHGPNAMYTKTEKTGGLEHSYLEGGWNSVPVFITEWGTTHSDGAQSVDEANTKWWFDTYINKKDHYLSHCNWSVSALETSSAFSSGTSPSASGTVVRKFLLNQTTDEYPPPSVGGNVGPAKDTSFAMPGTHPASRYNLYFGGSIGVTQVPYLDWDEKEVRTAANQALKILPGTTADWVSYKFKSASATTKAVFRVLAKNGSGTAAISVDGQSTGTLTITKEAGWTSKIVDVAVPAGDHVLKLTFTNAATDGFLIEWIELTNNTAVITPIRQTASMNLAPSSIATFENGFAFSLAGGHEYFGYRITASDGRMVKSGVIGSADRIVQVNGLVPGVFFVQLAGKNSTTPQRVMISGR